MLHVLLGIIHILEVLLFLGLSVGQLNFIEAQSLTCIMILQAHECISKAISCHDHVGTTQGANERCSNFHNVNGKLQKWKVVLCLMRACNAPT
jgi:hypothetical protein